MIEQDPLFIDLDNWNFSYQQNSPCIDAGDPLEIDPDGSRRDIGTYFSNTCSNLGDINNDNSIDIIDVVQIVSQIINNDLNSCSDINSDNQINVLDVIELVNLILN